MHPCLLTGWSTGKIQNNRLAKINGWLINGFICRGVFIFWNTFFPWVHPTDPCRFEILIPGEQRFFLKALNSTERQRWIVALGSCKAGVTNVEEVEKMRMLHFHSFPVCEHLYCYTISLLSYPKPTTLQGDWINSNFCEK